MSERGPYLLGNITAGANVLGNMAGAHLEGIFPVKAR